MTNRPLFWEGDVAVMTRSRLLGVAVACLIFVSVSLVGAEDWPQWRGANRDGRVTGFTAPEVWPKALTQKWKTTVGLGAATPALVGDRLYVFARQDGNEVALCLDAASGKEIWRYHYAAQAVSGPAARHPGPRSSPAVADGKVVTLGVGGVLSCLDAADGKLVWRKEPFQVVPRYFTGMSPIITDGMVVAHLGGQKNGALIAFDLATGDERWRWAAEAPEYASPVLLTVGGTKQIVTLTEKSIVGIGAADGKLLWKSPFVPQGRAYNAATPIVDGQTVICTGSGRGTKALKVEKQGEGFAVEELWNNAEVAVQFNTPVLKNGLLFGLTDRDKLFCIDAKTGKTVWMDTTTRGRGGFAAVLDAGSVMMALTNDSQLTVFAPTDKGYVELARIKVADTPTYAHPVIAGKNVFVKEENAVTLWAFE